MARENQGLQIALIIFVMLTIILGVTTFLFYRQYEEAAAKAAEFQQKATENENTASKIQGDYNTLKQYVGVAATEGIDTIGEQFRADMSKYAASVPEQQWSYQEALRVQFETIQARTASFASADDANRKLQATIEQLELSKAPLVEQEKQRADAANAQLAQERTAFNDARTALQEQQNKELQLYRTRRQEADKQQQALQTQIQDLLATNDDLQKLLDERNQKIIEIVEPTFEMADGKIRWVNQRNQTVWINLGRADALQRLTSFSVYPADTNDVTKVGKKASIEVTQILGDHLAEARIVEDEPADPIMPGDVIHTPVWAPGEQEHFALTGLMDLDNDGRSDLQTIIRIITLNGGVVDVFLAEDGQRHGNFTNQTRYMVRGDDPTEQATPAFLEAHKAMIDDAEQRGLLSIQLKDLLDKMGWKNQTPVVRFGRTAGRIQPTEGIPSTSTGEASSPFQPRRPPRASRGSAY